MKTALYCGALALAGAYSSAASAIEIEGVDTSGGGFFRTYHVQGVPLLDSFDLRFTGGEHNIQTIAVQPASPVPNPCFDCIDVPPGFIYVGFHDDTDDDEFEYFVSHVDSPAPVTRHRISDYCESTCKMALDPHPRGSVFVIVGFSLEFPGVDHNLQRVGLWERDGVLEVHFEDENHDNLFRFELEYVWLPPELIPFKGNISGVAAHGSDEAKLLIPPATIGPTVLRGFDFVFWGEIDWGRISDQEVQEFGVRTPGNKIQVFCDNGEQDAFDWGVDWGVLSTAPSRDPPVPDPPVKF